MKKTSSLVREIVLQNAKSHAISAFKMAMMNFDQDFFKYYNWLIEENLKEIFHQVLYHY
jgi:hypothetical protein